jgi:ABC-type branched-subunit amino acid transport system substrate-binding protein
LAGDAATTRVVAFLAPLALLALGCLSEHDSPADEGDIMIGTVLPFSGERAASGVALEQALRLAIDMTNDAGGLAGKRLSLKVMDSHSDDARGTANALDIIDKNPLSYFIGPEEPKVAFQIANAVRSHQLIHLLPGLTSPVFHDPSNQAAWFRLSPSVSYLACALAKHMYKQGVSRATVVVDPDDYASTFATLFGRVLTDQGGSMLPVLHISADATSFDGVFSSITRYAPDAAVLVTSPAVAAAFLQEWVVRGKPSRWYLGPTLNNAELLRNVPAGVLDGVEGISPDLGSQASAFEAFFTERTTVPPVAGSHYYFDAVAMLALAVADGIAKDGAMPTPASFWTHMQAVSSYGGEPIAFDQLAVGLGLVSAGTKIEYRGAAGNYVLNAQGDSIENRGAIWRIADMGFQTIDYEQCADSEVYNAY